MKRDLKGPSAHAEGQPYSAPVAQAVARGLLPDDRDALAELDELARRAEKLHREEL